MPDPSSTCLFFSAISEGSGETVWMCRLAWSFPACICNKYLNHMKWYRQLCLTLHLRVFFLVQSVKALARLCKYAVSPDHLLFAYATSTKLCLHPFFAVRFAKALAILHICAVSPDHSLLAHGTSTKPPRTGPEILARAFNYIPSFLGICCSHMRHVPNFLVLAYKISLGLHLNPFFLGIRCSHMR